MTKRNLVDNCGHHRAVQERGDVSRDGDTPNCPHPLLPPEAGMHTPPRFMGVGVGG